MVSSASINTTSTFTAINSLMDGAEQVDGNTVQFTDSRQGTWGKGFGGFGRANGANMEDYGGIAGYGTAVNRHLVLGAAFTGIGAGTSTAQQTVDSQSFGAFGYAIDTQGHWRLSATLGAGYLHQNSTRYLYPSNVVGTGATDGWYTGAGIQAQYLVPLGQAFLMPYGRISYLHTQLAGFTEQGAVGGGVDMNIRYGGLSTSVAAFSGGLRMGYDLRTPGATIIPWVSVGGTGYAGTLYVTQAETVGLLASSENGLVAPDAALNTDAGLTLTGRHDPWTLKVAYNGQFAENVHLNTFDVLANYRW